MRRLRAGAAFTLMELTVVMLIMALTFAIVLPISENATPGFRLESAQRIIGSFIESSHSESVASRRPFGVVYDFDNRAFWTLIPVEQPIDGDPERTQWVLDPNDEEARTEPDILPDDISFASVETAEGESYTGGQRIIEFDPQGHRGSHAVTLRYVDLSGDGPQLTAVGVKYNVLTRSLVYGDGQLSFYKE
jgi:Tfp pilus assembly protein FimT